MGKFAGCLVESGRPLFLVRLKPTQGRGSSETVTNVLDWESTKF